MRVNPNNTKSLAIPSSRTTVPQFPIFELDGAEIERVYQLKI